MEKFGYVYLIRNSSGLYKIGRSKDVHVRLHSLLTANSEDLQLIDSRPFKDAVKAEAFVHNMLWQHHKIREWYELEDLELWVEAIERAKINQSM